MTWRPRTAAGPTTLRSTAGDAVSGSWIENYPIRDILNNTLTISQQTLGTYAIVITPPAEDVPTPTPTPAPDAPPAEPPATGGFGVSKRHHDGAGAAGHAVPGGRAATRWPAPAPGNPLRRLEATRAPPLRRGSCFWDAGAGLRRAQGERRGAGDHKGSPLRCGGGGGDGGGGVSRLSAGRAGLDPPLRCGGGGGEGGRSVCRGSCLRRNDGGRREWRCGGGAPPSQPSPARGGRGIFGSPD